MDRIQYMSSEYIGGVASGAIPLHFRTIGSIISLQFPCCLIQILFRFVVVSAYKVPYVRLTVRCRDLNEHDAFYVTSLQESERRVRMPLTHLK